jgi:hypothetical protein
MSFDWLNFFKEHNVPYVTTGPNVSAGRAAVKCPFCGPDDPSEHMVVSLKSNNWWCWRRRSEHKGRSPEWLIQNLIHCSFDQARILTGGVTLTDDFLNQVQGHLAERQPIIPDDREIKFPETFKVFSERPSSRPYNNYLERRGFDKVKILQRFSRKYGMRYCTDGAFAGRIIFPVRHNQKLMAWTGRTITKRDPVRYKALATTLERAQREGTALAINPISHNLLWFDQLMVSDADTIVMCEGPFDSLKVRELGRSHGITSTCFFTTAPTDPQINLLHELLPRFKHRYLLLDPEMIAVALRVSQQLGSLNIKVKQVPDGVEDPGELLNLNFLTD